MENFRHFLHHGHQKKNQVDFWDLSRIMKNFQVLF